MSRDNILHRIRTALGRSAGQAVADFPPARIRIPDVDIEKRNRLEKLAFRAFAWLMTHPRLYEMAGKLAATVAPPGAGWINSVPAPMNIGPLRAWLSQRDLPPAPARSFREMWRRR